MTLEQLNQAEQALLAHRAELLDQLTANEKQLAVHRAAKQGFEMAITATKEAVAATQEAAAKAKAEAEAQENQ